MGRAVCADQTGTVQSEAHRQVLYRHVVHDLIVGALQEGRVDCAERLVAFGCETFREGYAMLLGDADVKGPLRKSLLEDIDASSRRHGGGYRDDLVVLLRFLDEALAEYLGVGRGVRLRLCL